MGERRMMDAPGNDVSEYVPNPQRDKLEEMTRSPELAAGLHAVLLAAFTTKNKVLTQTITDVSQAFRTVRFRAAKKLRSALFWKAVQIKKKKDKKKKKEEEAEKKDEAENGTKKDDKDKVDMDDKRSDAEIEAEKLKEAEEKAKAAAEESSDDEEMDVPEGDFNVIEGSERDQQFYYDEHDRSIYVGSTNQGEDSFAAELVVALRRALPLLWHVDSFLLEALFRCAINEGVKGLSTFLSNRDIEVDDNAPRHLVAGDKLPEDLEVKLIWSMGASYNEGECVAVLTDGQFTIAEIVKFTKSDEGEQEENKKGIQRRYMLKLGPESVEPRKHFEVYKIKTVSLEPTEKEETKELAVF